MSAPDAPPDADAATRAHVRAGILIAGALLGFVLCYRVAVPFLTPLTIALILAVCSDPWQRIIERKLNNATAATVTVIGVAALTLVPLFLLAAALVQEAGAGAKMVSASLQEGVVQRVLSRHEAIASVAERIVKGLDVAEFASTAGSWLTTASTFLVKGSVAQAVTVFVTFYSLFYFLRDRDRILSATLRFMPFGKDVNQALLGGIRDTIQAIVFGTVVTGIVQGVLGGAIFAAVGIPAPLFWGLLMGLFAILPVLGTSMVWVPAAIFLAFTGEWANAIVLSALFIAISVLDSFLYPVVVGNRMRLHSLVVFVAGIGGILAFGPIGFVLGPIAIVATFALREVVRARYQDQVDGEAV